MPLIKGKSKKSFDKNIATEIDSGKPKDQSLAIAYNTARMAKKKKMARGGIVEGEYDKNEISRNSGKKALLEADWTDTPTEKQAAAPSPAKLRKQDDYNWDTEGEAKIDDASSSEDEEMLEGKRPSRDQYGNSLGRPDADESEDDRDLAMYARGGSVDSDDMSDDEKADSIAEAIMNKRKRKKMADGGSVESGIEDNNEEQPNTYDRRNEAALKENYNDSFLSLSEPLDSNLKGDSEESSEEDDLDMISKIRSKIRAKKGM